MKKFVVSLIMTSLVLSAAHTLIPFAGYLLHHSHIVEDLCVKKDLPDEENDCQGFCFLKTQLTDHNEMHDQEQDTGFFSPVLFSFQGTGIIIPEPHPTQVSTLYDTSFGIELSGHPLLLTPPPRI